MCNFRIFVLLIVSVISYTFGRQFINSDSYITITILGYEITSTCFCFITIIIALFFLLKAFFGIFCCFKRSEKPLDSYKKITAAYRNIITKNKYSSRKIIESIIKKISKKSFEKDAFLLETYVATEYEQQVSAYYNLAKFHPEYSRYANANLAKIYYNSGLYGKVLEKIEYIDPAIDKEIFINTYISLKLWDKLDEFISKNFTEDLNSYISSIYYKASTQDKENEKALLERAIKYSPHNKEIFEYYCCEFNCNEFIYKILEKTESIDLFIIYRKYSDIEDIESIIKKIYKDSSIIECLMEHCKK